MSIARSLVVALKADTSGFASGMEKAGSTMKKFGRDTTFAGFAMKEVKSIFAGMTIANIVTGAFSKLAESWREAAKYAKDLRDGADALGVSLTSLAGAFAIGAGSGKNSQDMLTLIETLGANLGKGETGNFASAISSLKLDMDVLTKMDPAQAFFKIATAINSMDGTKLEQLASLKGALGKQGLLMADEILAPGGVGTGSSRSARRLADVRAGNALELAARGESPLTTYMNEMTAMFSEGFFSPPKAEFRGWWARTRAEGDAITRYEEIAKNNAAMELSPWQQASRNAELGAFSSMLKANKDTKGQDWRVAEYSALKETYASILNPLRALSKIGYQSMIDVGRAGLMTAFTGTNKPFAGGGSFREINPLYEGPGGGGGREQNVEDKQLKTTNKLLMEISEKLPQTATAG